MTYMDADSEETYTPLMADAMVLDEDKPLATGSVVFHPLEQEDENIPFVKGEVQTLEYRDINFARAFCLQFLAVILIAVIYGPSPLGFLDANEDEISALTALLIIVLVSLGTAAVGIAGFLTLMMHHTESVLKVSFVAAPALLLALGVALWIADPDSAGVGAGVLLIAVVFATVSAWVYHLYRPFIPFAVSTLRVAGMAIRANRGLLCLTAIVPLCLVGWYLLWGWAVVGVLNQIHNDGPMLLVLVFSFYWTQQVIIHVFHTTTAGTVGAWWFTPLADPSLCSMEVVDSLHRSLTYSFGSICCGSLLVALLQTLEYMARSTRRNRNVDFLACILECLACILECLLHFLRAWVEYFTPWAFCYVGLYGYDLLTAGKCVKALFISKGWSTFASDRMVFLVLYLANWGVSILSGGAACLVARPLLPDGDFFSPSWWLAFWIGFWLGAAVSHTALFVVESAVRTVIICFAESPAEFEECHPDLCQLMREGWAAAYPNQWEACPIVWATPTHRANNLLAQAKIPTATAIV